MIKKLFNFIKNKRKFLSFRKAFRQKNENNQLEPVNMFDIEAVNAKRFTYGDLYVETSDCGNKLNIGSFCSLAHGVKFLLAAEHPTDYFSTFPFKVKLCGKDYEAFGKGDINVGDDVWIGTNAIILSGVNIGRGAVIAAGAVVNKDVPPYSVVGGVPAKVIKYRFSDEIIEELMKVDFDRIDRDKIADNVSELYKKIENKEDVIALTEKIYSEKM